MRIVLATDGSPHAEAAEHMVTATAWPADTHITVIRAQEPLPGMRGLPDEAHSALYEKVRDALDDDLDQLERDLRGADRVIERIVDVGRPATLIVDAARHMGADLIVMGSRGRGAIASTVLGSVAAEVVDQAPCPVLVARCPTITRVVVADDGSDCAAQAEEVVASWPFLRGARVHVVSVADLSGLVPASTGMEMISAEVYQQAFDEVRALHEGYARAAADRLRILDPQVSSSAREGFVAQEIVATAEDERADLIVVGTRGQTGLQRVLVGSVARSVLFHAPVSVLTVRQKVEVPAAASPRR